MRELNDLAVASYVLEENAFQHIILLRRVSRNMAGCSGDETVWRIERMGGFLLKDDFDGAYHFVLPIGTSCLDDNFVWQTAEEALAFWEAVKMRVEVPGSSWL